MSFQALLGHTSGLQPNIQELIIHLSNIHMYQTQGYQKTHTTWAKKYLQQQLLLQNSHDLYLYHLLANRPVGKVVQRITKKKKKV